MGEVYFAITTKEEGLGCLKGIKNVVKQIHPDIAIVVDGEYPYICYENLNLLRCCLLVSDESGHSKNNIIERDVSVHLCQYIVLLKSKLLELEKNISLNVNRLYVNSPINVIPEFSYTQFEIRTNNSLKIIKEEIEKINNYFSIDLNYIIFFKIIDERKKYLLSESITLLKLVHKVNNGLGLTCKSVVVNSELDYLLSCNIDAIAIGIGIGGRTHTASEYLDTSNYDLSIFRLWVIVLGCLFNISDIEKSIEVVM
ncbi:hypothetical protein [Lutispora thermophila]|uniref:hypothetical protein n=1 Tax=Lutispora thermophila TaxID=288966 RepID=UPI001114DA49|nr:hypothetical protein [Lutispora thermophila]